MTVLRATMLLELGSLNVSNVLELLISLWNVAIGNGTHRKRVWKRVPKSKREYAARRISLQRVFPYLVLHVCFVFRLFSSNQRTA